jgi:hypothetical protein
MKPTTQRSALLSASHCTHPDVDAADKMLLVYFVIVGDFGTGKNAHPGNDSLLDAASISKATTKRRLAKLIERGLIERTERGDGRSTASVYRILWDNPYFPAQTPGGERLTENNPAHLREPDSPRKAAHSDEPVKSKTGSLSSGNWLTGDQKLAHQKPKLAHIGEPTPPTHQKNTTYPPPPETEQREGGWHFLEKKHMADIGPWGKHTAAMIELIDRHGSGAVDVAIADAKSSGFEGVKSPIGVLIAKRLQQALAKITEQKAKAEQAAKEEEFQAASIERQTQEIIARRDRGRENTEMTPEQFLALE